MQITTKLLIKNAGNLYDTTNMEFTVSKPAKQVLELSETPFDWSGLHWTPLFHKGIVTKYSSDYNNLKLILKDDKMYLKNSLQKSFLQNNYQTYTYSQVVEAFKKLDDLFPFNIYDGRLTFVSMGIVIQEELKSFYDNWLEYKGKTPLVMRDNHKIYGSHFKSTNYNIKVYDKTFQVKNTTGANLNANYMRYEIEAKPRYFNNRKKSISIYNVSDLLDKEKYQILAEELLEVYKNIKKLPIINYKLLKPDKIKLLATYANINASKGIKDFHQHTYKKDRKEYLKLVRELNTDNHIETSIINKLNQQIQYSINN